MSDKENAQIALTPVQQFLAETLASAFELNVRTRSDFVTIYLDRIIAALQERMTPEQFIALANKTAGKQLDEKNIGMFRYFCKCRDESVAERLLHELTVEGVVRAIPGADLFYVLIAPEQSAILSSMPPANALAARFVFEVKERGYFFTKFTREALKRARTLRLINDQRLAERIDETQLGCLSEESCHRIMRAAYREGAGITGLLVIETLAATLLQDEETPGDAGDVWSFIIAPSVIAHLLGSPEDKKREEDQMETIPVPGSGDAPSRTSLTELSAGLPVREPDAPRTAAATRDTDPEISFGEAVSEPERELIDAGESEPDTDAPTKSGSETAIKAGLLELLKMKIGLAMENARVEDSTRDLLSQALVEIGVRMSDVNMQNGIVGFGDALCDAVRGSVTTLIAGRLRAMLAVLDAATPPDAAEDSPPRARISSTPTITVEERRAFPPPPTAAPGTKIASPPPRSRPLAAAASPTTPEPSKESAASLPPPPTSRRPSSLPSSPMSKRPPPPSRPMASSSPLPRPPSKPPPASRPLYPKR